MVVHGARYDDAGLRRHRLRIDRNALLADLVEQRRDAGDGRVVRQVRRIEQRLDRRGERIERASQRAGLEAAAGDRQRRGVVGEEVERIDVPTLSLQPLATARKPRQALR